MVDNQLATESTMEGSTDRQDPDAVGKRRLCSHYRLITLSQHDVIIHLIFFECETDHFHIKVGLIRSNLKILLSKSHSSTT